MKELFGFINTYAAPLTLFVQVFLALFVLYLKDKFAPKSVIEDMRKLDKAQEESFDKLESRVSELETKISFIPDKADFHHLDRKICELQGDLKRIDQNLDGVEKIYELLQTQTNRMEEFLKRTS